MATFRLIWWFRFDCFGGFVSVAPVVLAVSRWFRFRCFGGFVLDVSFRSFRFGSFSRFRCFSRFVVSGFSLCPEEQQKFYPVKISLKHVHTVDNR